MEELRDVKLVNAETKEVLIEFDTLKVSGCESDKEKKDEKNT